MKKSKVEYKTYVNFKTLEEQERKNILNKKLVDIINLEINSTYCE